MYVSELAMVHFTLIKNTSEWYMAAFRDGRMASGFVQWAWERVEEYAELFRRQVYGSEEEGAGGEMVGEMREISLRLASQLKEVGLDFSFLLEQLLEAEPGTVRQEDVQTAAQTATEGGSEKVKAPTPVIPRLRPNRSSRIGMEGEQTLRERQARQARSLRLRNFVVNLSCISLDTKHPDETKLDSTNASYIASSGTSNLWLARNDNLALHRPCLDPDPRQDAVIPLRTLPLEILEDLCP